MTLKTTIAVAATGLTALAGCGTQNATDQAQHGAQKAQTAAQRQRRALSPQAQQLLERAQGLAGDVTTTAKDYANQDVSKQQALSQLDGYRRRASDLANQAEQLPATDRARGRLMRLTDQLRQTTRTLQTSVDGSGDATQLQAAVTRLRATASTTYDQLRAQLPASTRQRIDDAVKALGA